MYPDYIDITPTPRVLWILGEIPFLPWQCFAELIDNSIDALMDSNESNDSSTEKKITVAWSRVPVGSQERSIEVIDYGPGMTLEKIQNAVRAGYSSNDPLQNLGLFGMGFNIATARLGEKTLLLSATIESDSWIGVEIDFGQMMKNQGFMAKIVKQPKIKPNEHGTKVIITNIKDGIYDHLISNENLLRRQLENVYSILLLKNEVEILIQGKRLSPKKHCVWSESRYVIRDGEHISAVIKIDRILGTAYFNIENNRYLSLDQEADIKYRLTKGEIPPSHIIERQRRLTGWIGIQRFSDPNDFGLDFIRNGRKILIANKSLFSFENSLTGTTILEYPIELGSTVGGRIVGELNVDYLIPTYQKNDFDRTDSSWFKTIEILRGIGPILPKSRKSLGFNDDNKSPLGLLINAFRRTDPGTKCLAIDKNLANEFLKYYRAGESEYQNDDKWWKAAIEADRSRATGGAEKEGEIDGGDLPSDDPTKYVIPTIEPTTTNGIHEDPLVVDKQKPLQETSTLSDLMIRATPVTSWSGTYFYSQMAPFNVKVWELNNGEILKRGEIVPSSFFSEGIDCDFVYNPRNLLFTQYPINPKNLLLVYLAEKFKARDGESDIVHVYSKLIFQKMQESRIDKIALQEKADQVLRIIREKMIDTLTHKSIEVLQCIHESSGESEETVNAMLSSPQLIHQFQKRMPEGILSLEYVPGRTLVRLVDRFPEDLFDGKVFAALYQGIAFSDKKATERSRIESKDRIVAFLKDTLNVVNQKGGGNNPSTVKLELARAAISIDFLFSELSL